MFRFTLRILIALAFAANGLADDERRFISMGGTRFDAQGTAGLRALQEAAKTALATNPPSKVRRGLSAIQSLATDAMGHGDTNGRAALLHNIAEVTAALRNNERSPIPRSVDVFQVPFVHRRYISGRVGMGTKPAVNLPPPRNARDLSRLDPLPSTFWSRPIDISGQDLRVGFGRSATPHYSGVLWDYSGPKTSYGGNAGFEARNHSQTIKVKFGEIHSEPFAARIFHALGYNVEPTDYSAGLKIKYDPRLLAEFNSRKPVDTRITALGFVPVWTIHFQPRHDPLKFIAAAVLKNGTTLTGPRLRARLVEGGDLEAQIDYLITVPANVQVKNSGEKNIGPWDFGQLGHADLRELRGAGLLAAWLGWFDSRFDNTRLRVVKSGSRAELKHVFADLGGGLGRSTGWFGWRGELPEEFPDHFTRPEIRQGPGKMTIPFRIVNFRPIESTPAFREMTIDDARWMARLIAQLTERQIVDALQASGFAEREVEIYRHKMLNRRERMIRDLNLGGTSSTSP